MATIKELRALFSAEASNLKAIVNGIKTDFRNMGRSSNQAMEQANKGVRKFEQSLNDLEEALRNSADIEDFEELNRTIRDVREELRTTGRVSVESMETLNRVLGVSQSELRQLGNTNVLEGLISQINSTQSSLQEMSNEGVHSINNIEQAAQSAQSEISQMSNGANLNSLNDQLQDSQGNMEEMGEAGEESSGVLFGAFGKIKAGALIAVGATLAVGAAVVKLIDQGNELQEALNSLQVQTGATNKEMEGMEESLVNIYRSNLGEDFHDIADSMSLVRQMTGQTGKELEETTKNALLMRKSFKDMEVQDSVRAASTMMKTFGITSTEAYTLMAQGAQKGVNMNSDMLDVLNEYSPQFKALGYDSEGFMDVLISGAEAGAFSMDKLADGAKESFLRIGDGSKGSRDALKGLGLDFNQVENDINAGGDSAQKAFTAVTSAIASIEDPAEQSRQTIALMGTPLEDLGPEFQTFFSNVTSQADKSANTLEQINKVKFNSVGEAMSGLWRIIQADVLIPLEQKLMPTVNKFANFLKTNLPAALRNMKSAFNAVFGFLEPYIRPIINSIVSFVGQKVSQLQKFWSENGQQITQAAKNAFSIILSIVKFFMPAVLFIINMVWTNIKGVIDGALKIIMGLIKIFAGLFTGDFSKMWEGIKQLFFGAIQFVWNLINLMMFGRILGGIKTFVTSGLSWFKTLWQKTVSIFKNLDTNVSSLAGKMLGFLRNSWNSARNSATSIFTRMKDSISGIFSKIVDGAKALPSKIGAGIKSMAGKALDGVKFLGNKMISNLAVSVNGVIDGVNWVLGKVGVDKKIKKWSPPEYKKGTDDHPGGLAIVGDGKKRELILTPDGKSFLSPDKDTLVNLPAGSQVLSGENTEKLMNSLPAYKKGKGLINSAIDGVTNVANNAVEKGKEISNKAVGKGKEVASKAKEAAFDVWNYISDPKELFNKAMDMFGVEAPSFPGELKDFGKGAFKLVKDNVFEFMKKKIEGFMSMGGSSVNITGGAKAWKNQILKAAAAMKESISGSELNGIIAQIQRESGGNQKITQSPKVIDVNTLNGNPARGLLQYIPQTFRKYAVRGYSNIYDGYHQLLAFFNNTNWRKDLPYGKSGWGPSGSPKINGFYEGARVAVKQLAWIAEKGAEYVIPTDGGQRAYDLWRQAGAENGFTNTETASGNVKVDVNVGAAPIYLDGYEIAKVIFNYINDMMYDDIETIASRKG